MIDPAECKYPGWYELPKDNQILFDEMYSMLLASYMAKRPVKVFVAECSSSGHSKIDQVYSVE